MVGLLEQTELPGASSPVASLRRPLLPGGLTVTVDDLVIDGHDGDF